jgi:hypothetical protein
MKDQVTAIMEAIRLVEAEVQKFKRRGKGRDETLDAIEAILDDPKIAGAVRTIETLVHAPRLVPEQAEAANAE